jgi:Domain of unknown function (DUF4189)
MAMTRSYARTVCLILFLSAPTYASAQCPAGIPSAGNPQCVPPDVFYNSLPNTDPPPLPSPKWATRWGSIAVGIGPGGGVVGASRDATSKRKAEKEAMKQCRQHTDSRDCRIEISYYNQCGVLAWGENYYHTARAATVSEASGIAISSCNTRTSNCKLFYSNCSYPVRVR